MPFKTPEQIASEMVATARYITRGKRDPFDGCPVGDARYYFAPRCDVTVRNGAQVARAICQSASPQIARFACEAIAHMALPDASHDARDAFKASCKGI